MSPVARFVLIFLMVIGLNPRRRRSKWNKFLALCLLSSNFNLLLSMILQAVLNWKGIDSISRVLYTPGIFTGLCKCLFLMIHQKEIKLLLDGAELLWPLDKFGRQIETTMKNYQLYGYKYMSLYLYTSGVCMFFLVAKGLWEDDLIFSCYTLCDVESSACYDLYMVWQIAFSMFQGIPMTMGFDGFFLHMIIECYIGMEMIKVALKMMFDEARHYNENIKDIIIQHNAILRYIKQTNRLFSNFLLIQFTTSLLTQILCLFMTSLDGFPPDIKRLSIYGVPYIVFLLQLLLYCLGGDLIMSQALSIADAAYDVPWYDKDKLKLRKPLAAIILRSQRAETMLIGNLQPLNLATFLSILRNSLSLCGLLQSLRASQNDSR